jgi:hypothetical protein
LAHGGLAVARNDASVFTPHWTTAIVRFTVKKATTRAASPHGSDLDTGEKIHAIPAESLSR